MSRQSDAFIDALDGIATEYNAELQNLAAEEDDRDVPLRMADDPVLQQASRISSVLVHHHPDFPRVVAAFHGDDSLAPLHPKEGYLDPMILHPGGGIRVNAETVVRGLLASAAQRIYFYGLDWDAGVMQAAVADGVVQLRRAVRGEAISVYYLTGFDGLTLPADREVDTPWGKLRATPIAPPTSVPRMFSRRATLFLSQPIDTVITIDRAAEPAAILPDEASARSRGRANLLFPLACCLATESDRRVAPLETWQTTISPFGSGFGYGQAYVLAAPRPRVIELTESEIERLRYWCTVVDQRHQPSLNVAARRVVSALAQRVDVQDRLIDAVIAWENLFGAMPETSFRLCAAITKLITSQTSERRTRLARLLKIYKLRSRVAHGSGEDAAALQVAADESIDIAINCLRILYTDRADLLSLKPSDRADTLLLN
jgi:hypothetical protein